jgi:hypothetical protein
MDTPAPVVLVIDLWWAMCVLASIFTVRRLWLVMIVPAPVALVLDLWWAMLVLASISACFRVIFTFS